MPLTLSRSAVSAPSKADEIRAESAQAVAAWRASRSATPSAAPASPALPSPASPAAGNPSSVQLDALFDGSLPPSRKVLERAAALDVGDAALGRAIAGSKTAADAAARLQALGILGPREAALADSDADRFRFLLTRLWRRAAPSVPSAFKIDSSWSIPALKVERGGTTYFVHAVTHGQLAPPRRGAVLRLAGAVTKAGRALYSEQNLPAYYGYTAGRETLDHASIGGASAAIVPAAGGQTAASVRAQRAINWLVSPGSALGALAWVLVQPVSIIAWLALAGLSFQAWKVMTGTLPLLRWRRRRRAAAARADGLEDMADQYADEAANFLTAKPDLEVLRGLELPQPLGGHGLDPESVDSRYSTRSRAIADAVAADAAAAGAPAVHLVVGHLHAHEVAWRLVEGPSPATPKSQVS